MVYAIIMLVVLALAFVFMFVVSLSLFLAGVFRKSTALKLAGIPAAIMLTAGVVLGGYIYGGIHHNHDPAWIFEHEFGRPPQGIRELQGTVGGFYGSGNVYLSFRISASEFDRLLDNRYQETDLKKLPYYPFVNRTTPFWWRPPQEPPALAYVPTRDYSLAATSEQIQLGFFVYDPINGIAYYSRQ